MILCSCNVLTDRDVRAVIALMRAEDSFAVITPGAVYHRLGKRGRCCGCFPQVITLIIEQELGAAESSREPFTAEQNAA